MSKTDLNSTTTNGTQAIDTAYVDSLIQEKSTNAELRHSRDRNIVQFFLRGNSGSSVAVERVIGKRLNELNGLEQNKLNNMVFDRAYSVKVFFSFKNPITGKTAKDSKTVARVGIIGKRKYLLTSSGVVAMQTRTRQNEDDLSRALATIAQAKKLAESKGVVNDNEFFLALPDTGNNATYITSEDDGFDI